MRSPALLISSLLLLASCGSDPAPREAAVRPEDREFGARQHPVLLAEFGGAYGGQQAAYVAALGNRLADAAGLPGQCTFTLVNSDVVNAFAVPGCFIYVTRGLMAIVNSEAELAAVLSHELGHITGDHSGRQQDRSLLRQLSVVAVGLLTGSETLTRLAGEAAAFFTLRYSRTQEYEADDLGIRYMTAAGYDPYEAADMLDALGRQERFQAGTRGRDEARSMPEWSRTHPLTENRVERAAKAAEATGVADNQLPENAPAFLSALNGMLYGDDPEQGFILGRRFLHPVMRIAFDAPEGFTLSNSPQAILIEGPDGLRGEFSGGRLPRAGLGAYVEQMIGQLIGDAPAQVGRATTAMVNGVSTIAVPVLVRTDQGEARLSIAAYGAPDGSAYHFILAGDAAGDSAAIDRLFSSFRFLSPAEAAELRPRRIAVVRAGPGDTPRSLAARMASDHPLEQFLMLNDRAAGDALRPGDPVKLVRFAAGR